MTRPRALDLFCGAAGGWTLGLHRAGFETIAACEADPWRRAVFKQRWPSVRMYDDVRTLTGTQVIADVGPVDLVAGSPPCPDFSAANAHGKGIDGERGALFLDAIRIVAELRPDWVALENVPGIRTRGIDRILAGLEAEGYACWPLVVGAVHAGAPHRRQRVWIVAHTARDRCGAGRTRRPDPSGAREPERAFHDAHADGRQSAQPWRLAAGCEQVGARLAQRSGEPCKDGKERSPPERDGPLAGYSDWNGGPPDLGRVDDGVSRTLASIRVRGDGRQPDVRRGRASRKLKTTGVGSDILAAYGDAVIPQIAEAIGHAIMSAEHLLAAAPVPARAASDA